MGLYHLIHANDPNRVDQALEVYGNCTTFSGDRVFWPLHRKWHPPVCPDNFKPSPLDIEDLNCHVHHRTEFRKEPRIITFSLIGGTGAV